MFTVHSAQWGKRHCVRLPIKSQNFSFDEFFTRHAYVNIILKTLFTLSFSFFGCYNLFFILTLFKFRLHINLFLYYCFYYLPIFLFNSFFFNNS